MRPLIVTGPRENRRGDFAPTKVSTPPLSILTELNSKMESVTVTVGQVNESSGLYPAGTPVGRELSISPLVATIGRPVDGSEAVRFLNTIPAVSRVKCSNASTWSAPSRPDPPPQPCESLPEPHAAPLFARSSFAVSTKFSPSASGRTSGS